jgi:hypothetical protein
MAILHPTTILVAPLSPARLDAVRIPEFVVWGPLSVVLETVLLLAMQNQIVILDMDPNGLK